MAKRDRFRKTVFDNGLTLLTEQHSEFRSFSIGVWVKTGSRHERPVESGVSHFIEHMLFKGTETRSALDIAREVDQVGGEFNAFTAREYTCFHLTLLDRDAPLGIDILTDVLLNSTFDHEELERERKVILQEIAMVEEAPEELVHDVFLEQVYGKHGLGRSILGTESSIRRMRRLDLLNYFRRHYRPKELVISAAGDVSHESIRRRLKDLARKDWPGRARLSASLSARQEARLSGQAEMVSAPSVREGCWWLERSSEQVHLVWGLEGHRYAARDRIATFLLNVYLGGGMSSSLFQEIREKKGLAYTVYSMLSPFLDSGLFTVYAATGMNQVPLCLKLIEESVGRMRSELLSDDQLRMVKENLKGTILLSADSMESRMSSLAMNEIYFGRYVSVAEVCRLVDETKAADIRRVARKLLGSGRRSILALGPDPTRAVKQRLSPVKLRR